MSRYKSSKGFDESELIHYRQEAFEKRMDILEKRLDNIENLLHTKMASVNSGPSVSTELLHLLMDMLRQQGQPAKESAAPVAAKHTEAAPATLDSFDSAACMARRRLVL